MGVWLDTDHAFLVVLESEDIFTVKIASGVEHYHPKGGSRVSTPYSSQDVMPEKKYLERKELQLKNYFHQILEYATDCDEIILMGPAEARIQLAKTIRNSPVLRNKLEGVFRVDSMTDNQMKASIIDHFRGEESPYKGTNES